MAADNKELIFKSTSLSNRSFRHFEFMKQKGVLCDISFKIGDETMSAHRVVLAAGIPYFYDLFSRKGTKLVNEDEFDLPDIDSESWKALVNYAYNGEVKINLDNVKQLLSAACHLNIEEVKTTCCNFWAEHICINNAISVQDFASVHDCTELSKNAGHFVRQNFERISETEDFLEMSLLCLKHLISADDLTASSEEKVFEAVMRWVKKYPENRKQYLPEILSKVRLPLLRSAYLRRMVLEEELIHESISCRDLITEAREYHTLEETEKLLSGLNSKPRYSSTNDRQEKGNESTICIISTELSLTVNQFNPVTAEWCLKEKQLYPMDSGSLESVNSNLYYFLGTNVLTCATTDYNWKSCSRWYIRHFAASVSHGYEIYMCGGINGDSVCNIVECFHTKSAKWSSVRNMNFSRIFASATSLESYIYVMGGMSGCSALDCVERYSPVAKIWTNVSPMLTKRWGHGSAALNGKIYVSGGTVPEEGERCVYTSEVYTPVINQWAFISSMKIPRSFLPIVPSGGKVYAFGGKNDEGKYVNAMEIYDPETDKWTFGTLVHLRCHTSGAAVTFSSVS